MIRLVRRRKSWCIHLYHNPSPPTSSGTGEVIHSLKNYKQSQSELFDAFPDVHLTIDEVIVEGDKAVVRWVFTGTHKGERWSIPPTNKVTIWAISIVRIADGKFVEIWERWDALGLMRQLGVARTPDQNCR